MHKKLSKWRRDAARFERYQLRRNILASAYYDFLLGPSDGIFPDQDPIKILGRRVPPMPSKGEVVSLISSDTLDIKCADVLLDRKRRYEHPRLIDP